MSFKIDPIALYAAIVATAGFAWSIYEWRHRKPHIKIKVEFFRLLGPGMDRNKLDISVTAMNVGRYATTLSITGLWTDSPTTPNWQQPNTGVLPKRLEPGESCFVIYKIEDLRKGLHESDPSQHIKFAWYKDQADRMYKGKIPKNVRKKLG